MWGQLAVMAAVEGGKQALSAHKKRKAGRQMRRAAEEQAMAIEDAAREKSHFLAKRGAAQKSTQIAGGGAQGIEGGSNDLVQLETMMRTIEEQEQVLAGARKQANLIRTGGAREKRAMYASIESDAIKGWSGLLLQGMSDPGVLGMFGDKSGKQGQEKSK